MFLFCYRLSYVRTVARHKAAVVAVAVSTTLGDVASVSHTGQYFFRPFSPLVETSCEFLSERSFVLKSVC